MKTNTAKRKCSLIENYISALENDALTIWHELPAAEGVCSHCELSENIRLTDNGESMCLECYVGNYIDDHFQPKI